MAQRRETTDLNARDARPKRELADGRDHCGPRRGPAERGTDGIEADGRPPDVRREERVEAGRALGGGQLVDGSDLIRGQLGATAGIPNRKRTLDAVDAGDPGNLAGE